MNGKDYLKASEAATHALRLDPDDSQTLEVLGQSQYLLTDYLAAVGSLGRLVTATERHQQVPKEAWLQMMLDSYHRLDNAEHAADTWESLLRHYAKPQYWYAVLRHKAAEDNSSALNAGYKELMLEVGVLKDPADYQELALHAVDAGVPSTAVMVLNAGLKNGSLGGANAPRYRRMLAYAKKQAQETEPTLRELAQRGTELPATSVITLGRIYLAQGRYDDAIAELQQGMKQPDGSLDKDPARVALGIAYLKNDQAELARATFGDVPATSAWHELADLWSLRVAND